MKRLLILIIFLFCPIYSQAASMEIVIQPGPEVGEDTYYGTVYDTNGRPDRDYFKVGGWGDSYYSYLQFNLLSLPDDAIIESAELQLYQFLESGNDNYVKIEFVTESWSEENITLWDNPASQDIGFGWTFMPTGKYWWVTDVTDVVRSWVEHPETNNGFKFTGQLNSDRHAKWFYSSDYLDSPEFRPKLIIKYSVTDRDLTVEELIETLVSKVQDDVQEKNLRNSYLAHLQKLGDFYDDGKWNALQNQVKNFKKKLEKDIEQGDIDGELGSGMLELTEELIATLKEERKVPLMTQVVSLYPPESSDWADDVFAWGDDYWCGNTIAGCGCAISSLAMLAQNKGISIGLDGQEINPGSLNSWLIDNNGYSANGNVIWNYALQYFSETPGFTHFTFDEHNSTNTNKINSSVKKGDLAVAYKASKGHYFLLTDALEGGNYLTNDPLWYETRTTNEVQDIANNVQSYGGNIDSANLFTFHKELKQSPSWIEIHLGSPAELLLTDEQGRRVGYDSETGNVINEIPGSSYSQAEGVVSKDVIGSDVHLEKVLMVQNPKNDLFSLEVIGTGTGNYDLTVTTSGGKGQYEWEHVASSTSLGQVDAFILDIADETGESRAVERLRELAEDKAATQPEVSGRLFGIAEKLSTRNVSAGYGYNLGF